jgi:hypothetical protein
VNTLTPGAYKLELRAQDSAGLWALRTTEFEIQ